MRRISAARPGMHGLPEATRGRIRALILDTQFVKGPTTGGDAGGEISPCLMSIAGLDITQIVKQAIRRGKRARQPAVPVPREACLSGPRAAV